MKPSAFLKTRYPEAMAGRAGEAQVTYTAKGAATIDSLTGDPVAGSAYAGSPVTLPALIDLAPARGTREKLGLEVTFDAVLYIAREHVEAAGLSIEIGDAFELPGETIRYYVTSQPAQDMQSATGFLQLMVPVARHVGRR